MGKRPILVLVVLTSAVLCAGTLLADSGGFPLSGGQQVPPLASPHAGSCTVVLSGDETQLSISCAHDIDDPIAAHFHLGAAGENGGVVFPLGDGASPIEAIWNLDADDVADLRAGLLYVNVHSAGNPAGEIRGQVRLDAPLDATTLRFTGSGDQQVPPVATAATASCRAVHRASTGNLQLTCVHDVVDPIAAHLHQGAPGVNGGVIIPLGSGVSPIVAELSPTPEELAMFFAGELYLNVHSQLQPAGEVRGQVAGCLADATTLCLYNGRFATQIEFATEESSTDDAPGPSRASHLTNPRTGSATEESADSGLFWFFSPDNAEVLIKVLDGCAITNHFWVFFSATTDVAFELTVVDTATGTSKSYSNSLGTAAEPVLDTSAFATCPG